MMVMMGAGGVALTREQGTMANSREFKESFGCAAKEPRCELW